MIPLFLTVKQCAEHLGSSRDYIYALIHRGELIVLVTGNRFRVRRESFERWLSEHQVSGSHVSPPGTI